MASERDRGSLGPVLDPGVVRARTGSSYPEPFRKLAEGRSKRALGDALGLKTFGVNLTRLGPGGWSSIRHWHSRQDEFIYVLEGELTLVTDDGEQTLTPGLAAGFPAGRANGHHLINKSDRDAAYLEVGDRLPGDEVVYPDVDLLVLDRPGGKVFTNRKGEPY